MADKSIVVEPPTKRAKIETEEGLQNTASDNAAVEPSAKTSAGDTPDRRTAGCAPMYFYPRPKMKKLNKSALIRTQSSHLPVLIPGLPLLPVKRLN